MSACRNCGHDEDEPPTLTAGLQDRRQVGGCLSCPASEQDDQVWVVKTGQLVMRLCRHHMTMLKEMTK